LLKLRNFVVRKNISDAEITGENGINIMADIVEAMEPFVSISSVMRRDLKADCP
jgi:uncharacterized protein (DUF2461 family)